MTPFERLFWWWRRRTAPMGALHKCDGDPCLTCITIKYYTPKTIDEIFTSKPMLWALRNMEEEE